ncbi:hypothetical protein N2152v2_009282 [Parachlorella kessleri]
MRVSAEAALNGAVQSKKRDSLPKPEETRARLKQLIKSTLLLHDLDEEQEEDLIGALFERKVAAGEVVIREGEVGDNFYLIESGRFLATQGGSHKFTYDGRGSFGELALMYNCPRAATVTAEAGGTLWCMDRATFRAMIVGSMVERRTRYEATLRSMEIFQHLSQEQLAAVADCLTVELYEAGQYILREKEELATNAKFYIVESGTVECRRTFDGKKRLTKSLGPGDVFGEVALLTKAPRQADCVAATKVKVLAMSRDAFERLMGPVEESLAQHIAEYTKLNEDEASPRVLPSRSATPSSQASSQANTVFSTQGSSAPTAPHTHPSSAPSSRASSHQAEEGHSHRVEAATAGVAAVGAAAAALVPAEGRAGLADSGCAAVSGGVGGAGRLRVSRSSPGDQGGSPSKLAAQIQEWEKRASAGSEAAASTPTKGAAAAGATSEAAQQAAMLRKGSWRGSSGAEGGAGEAVVQGSPISPISEADEARRIADLTAQPGDARAEVPACTLEPIVEEQNEGRHGSRGPTMQH